MRKEKGKGKEKGKEKEKGKKGKGKGLAPYDVVQSHFISYLHLDSKKILPLRRRQPSTLTTDNRHQSVPASDIYLDD